ncbi:hypothetical protein ACWCPM_32855 [Streptomyces sp. NPDC002309]
MITAMDHVQRAAPPASEERLRRFYVDILGMPFRATAASTARTRSATAWRSWSRSD